MGLQGSIPSQLLQVLLRVGLYALYHGDLDRDQQVTIRKLDSSNNEDSIFRLGLRQAYQNN